MSHEQPRVLHDEAWPPVGGRPGIAQGMYGRGGNIELVAPAVDDGLWVGWYNNDPDDDQSGAALRQWSGALRFGRGRRYVSADVTQAPDGTLETVALDARSMLVRHVWSAAQGYVERGELASGVTEHSAVVFDASGVARVAVRLADGAVNLIDVVSGAAKRIGEGLHASAAVHDGHIDVLVAGGDDSRIACPGGDTQVDAHSRAVIAGSFGRWVIAADAYTAVLIEVGGAARVPLGPLGEMAASAVAVDGRDCIDLVARDGLLVRHVRVDIGSARVVVDRPVAAQVWVESPVDTCHRCQ